MLSKIENYSKLEERLQEIVHLENIMKIANWDSATMLTSGSAANRQKEIATLSSVIHKMFTNKEIGDLINKSLNESDNLDDWQKSNLANARRLYDNRSCIHLEIQHEYSLASSECEFVWRTARKENNFKKLEPYLDAVFDSVRKIAYLKAEKFRKNPLDVLIDEYDPGRTSIEIQEVFDTLKAELPNLVHRIIDKQKNEKIIPLTQKISEETQKAIGLRIMEQFGFNFDYGRLDKSAHPFCTGSNDDVRITTRYDENYFLSSLFSVIHETGHALYQQNLPEEYRNQPVGQAKNMSFHESQSLIMENQVGISRSFMEYLAKILKDEFSFSGQEYSAENLYRLVTRVKPSFIRVDADEVTYPLHVILRFEIEREIICHNLRARDLPELWNKKMKEYLGIVPSNDSEGCMQDCHWPSGSLGYFPCYTNGAIIASMLMKKAKAGDPEIDLEIAQGGVSKLNLYLTENLRSYGCSKDASELLEISTGHKMIQPSIFIDYLKEKYL